jgi:cell wall-associated NlpC family hydrolase
MVSAGEYNTRVGSAIDETVWAYHLRATNHEGEGLVVPCSYQIAESGFRPFRAGKASPGELQGELDKIISRAEENGTDTGIENDDSVRKIAIQNGLGIDCSRFVFEALRRAYDRLELPEYTRTIFRGAENIRQIHNDRIWQPKDKEGNVRELKPHEARRLDNEDLLPVSWIAEVFGKDPEFISGSMHITNEPSSVEVNANELLPGDLIAFRNAEKHTVSHVGIVGSVERSEPSIQVKFWHSWHTRDFESGLRSDSLILEKDGHAPTWSHPGLGNPRRYAGYYFARPLLMKSLTDTF